MTKLKVFVVRGLPGSGKSTLARSLTSTVVEADDYFQTETGYKFNSSELKLAHDQCYLRFCDHLQRGEPRVAVSNTFTQLWEMQRYLDAAFEMYYQVYICEPKTPWCRDVQICFEKCIHRIPLEKVQQMHDRWEEPNPSWIVTHV